MAESIRGRSRTHIHQFVSRDRLGAFLGARSLERRFGNCVAIARMPCLGDDGKKDVRAGFEGGYSCES
jgi:hypothetical protein